MDLERLIKNNLKHTERYFKKYYDKLYKFIYFKCRNRDLTEDIVAQAFLKSIEKAEDFKGNSDEKFYAWICTIASNLLKDTYKKENKLVYANEYFEFISDSYVNIEESIENKEKAHEVRNVLQHLENDQRLAIEYKYFNDLSLREIAEIMNRSKDAVRMLIKRGEKNIGKILINKNKVKPTKKLMAMSLINSYVISITKESMINLSQLSGNMTPTIIITKIASLGIAKVAVIATTAVVAGTTAIVGVIQVTSNKNNSSNSSQAPVPKTAQMSNTTSSNNQTPNISNTLVQQSPIAQTTVLENDYSNWNSFTDDIYKIKIKYPKGWSIKTDNLFTLDCKDFSEFWKNPAQCKTFKNHAIKIGVPNSSNSQDFIIQIAKANTMQQTASCNTSSCSISTDTVTINNKVYQIKKATSQSFTANNMTFPFRIDAVAIDYIITGSSSSFAKFHVLFGANSEVNYQQMLKILESIEGF